MKKSDLNKFQSELSGGLSALLGGGGTPATEQEPQQQEPQQEEQAPEQEKETPEREDFLAGDMDEETRKELREALHRKVTKHRGRPRKGEEASKNPAALYTRFTTIMSRAQIAKLKVIGFRETLTMKEVIEDALRLAIENYEKTHGEIILEDSKEKTGPLFQ